MAIGKEIGNLISSYGISLKALSQKAGISYNTLYCIVKRDNETVKPEILEKIAYALNIPHDQFLNRISSSMFSDMMQRLDSIHEKSPDFQEMTDDDIKYVTSLVSSNFSIKDEVKRAKSKWALEEFSKLLPRLSNSGMDEAIKRVEELTHIPPYGDLMKLFEEQSTTNGPPTTE